MKKILSAALVSVMLLSSCGDSEESSSKPKNLLEDGGGAKVAQNVSEDDLPYGATIYELSSSNDDYVKVVTDFDKRYFSDEDGNPLYDEVHKIHDYIIAIDTNDHDLFKSVVHEGFYNEFCKENDMTIDEYIDNINDSFKTSIGSDSNISYIDISNCIYDGDGVQSFYDIRDEVLEKIGVTNVTSRKTVEVGGYTTFYNDSGYYQLTNYSDPFILCVYEIDGEIYIF